MFAGGRKLRKQPERNCLEDKEAKQSFWQSRTAGELKIRGQSLPRNGTSDKQPRPSSETPKELNCKRNREPETETLNTSRNPASLFDAKDKVICLPSGRK